MRYQWWSRLVGNPLIKVEEVMEPFARGALEEEACAQGQTVVLSIGQTTVRDRHGASDRIQLSSVGSDGVVPRGYRRRLAV
jgi:hypothetical protein